MNKINRKSIGDLYNEALRDADKRPPVIQPNHSSIHSHYAQASPTPDLSKSTLVGSSIVSNAGSIQTQPFPLSPYTKNDLPQSEGQLLSATGYDNGSSVQNAFTFPSSPQLDSGTWTNLLHQPNNAVVLAGAARPISQSSVQEASPLGMGKGNINEVFDQTDVREAIQVLATNSNQTFVVDDTV
jgi:hypothetical protein